MHDDQRPPFGEMLRTYRQAARLSQDELGLKTGLSTRAISNLERGTNRTPRKATLLLLADGLGLVAEERARFTAAAQPAPFATPHHNLPAQLTSFIGREAAVEAARQRLRQPELRLVSLLGPGGTGKTRLALEVAAGLLDDFAGGVYFINLTPIVQAAAVGYEVAQVLGVKEEVGQPLAETLRSYLREKHVLLLLDNFEHLLEASASVSALLAGTKHLKVLTTSREPLRLRGEQEFPVPPLALPDLSQPALADSLQSNEAVRLFVERAGDVKADFVLTDENARSVAEITHRLDGLPLAIELAVPLLKTLPPDRLLARLSHRLAVLTGGMRDLPPRQQTLRATISWSHDLLSPVEQMLFRRMAVFTGGCTLEALEAVCSAGGSLELDVLAGLAALTNKAMVRQQDGDGDEPRFGMLETIREYALERLGASGEEETIRTRHGTYFLDLAERAAAGMRGPAHLHWLERLDAEHENLRGALSWSQEQADGGMMSRLARTLFWFWYFRGYWAAGRAWLEAALARAPAKSGERARCLWAAGFLAFSQRDDLMARRHFEESLALARGLGDRWSLGHALVALAAILCVDPEASIAIPAGEEGVAILRELGDPWELGFGLLLLGSLKQTKTWLRGIETGVEQHYEESRRLFQQLGDHWGLGRATSGLGWWAGRCGDYAAARRLLNEALGLSTEQGDTQSVIWTLVYLSDIARTEGDLAAGKELGERVLALARELGDRVVEAMTLHTLGSMAIDEGDYSGGRALCEAGLALARELGDDQQIAWALHNLGWLAHLQQDDRRAIALHLESLVLFRKSGVQKGLGASLIGLVQAGGTNWPAAPTARLLGAVDTLLAGDRAYLDHELNRAFERCVAATRARLDPAEFAAAWADGRLLTEDEVANLVLAVLS